VKTQKAKDLYINYGKFNKMYKDSEYHLPSVGNALLDEKWLDIAIESSGRSTIMASRGLMRRAVSD
jgi:hypothetical protein